MQLEQPLLVDISYDTIVVQGGVLHIYPDVYQRGLNTPSRLGTELEAAGVNLARLDERTAKRALTKVTRRAMFVVGALQYSLKFRK